MVKTVYDKQDVIARFQRDAKDTGSPEVQIALLTERIRHLTEHLKACKKDFSARRGLLKLVGRRSHLLKYLTRTDRQKYLETIATLGLRR
ncbi:MAG: 30S ribosomal protein S15 [Phycisphaerales bacterium]|nr:MAG: 30S ribosomal protein S15 [Phycisphaerales bacterium]